MKSGTYRATFQVNLTGCKNETEGREAVMGMLNDMLDDDEFPEVDFELVEEFDLEYTTEEEIEELEF